jgi:hypothetical protein
MEDIVAAFGGASLSPVVTSSGTNNMLEHRKHRIASAASAGVHLT